MAASAFRRALEEAYRTHAQPAALARRVEEILVANGIAWRKGWTPSRLQPALEACRERATGDAAQAALLACQWLDADLGLDLVRRGLLAGDIRALRRIGAPSPVDSSRAP